MKKVKRIKSTVTHTDVTSGKIYEITDICGDFVCFLDDANERNSLHKSQFEEVKEPNYVMVRESEDAEWVKKILLHDLGEQFRRRYIVVIRGDEELYLSGENNVRISAFAQMKPINEVEQKIEELEEKLAELKQQINK